MVNLSVVNTPLKESQNEPVESESQDESVDNLFKEDADKTIQTNQN